MTRAPGGDVETPCIRRCSVDPESRLCLGCLRTIDEIAGWGAMTPDERRAIMQALPGRAGRIAPKGRGGAAGRRRRRTGA